MVEGPVLLLSALVSVVLLVLLIVHFKLHPFVSLVVVSLGLGIATGMPMRTIVQAFEAGVGSSLGHIALVVALGTMLGKMMAESGGADRIARTLIDAAGTKNVHWAMGAIGFIVGLPVFFQVGFVLLVPIAFSVAKRTGTSIVLVGIPMVAGLSTVHGLTPPHPGPLFAVTAYQADIGRTLFYGLLVGIPSAIVAGPLFAKLAARHVVPDRDSPLMEALTEDQSGQRLPGFAITLFTILLPVGLMLAGSWAHLVVPAESLAHRLLQLAGMPVMALLIALLVSFHTLGRARGFDRAAILRFTDECLGPIASVLLVVGAGAGFGRILLESGISPAVVELATSASVPPLLLGWLVAVVMRVAAGSATVAITTACGIVAPVAATAGVSPELMVIATGAGSLILSHVNDGGFWIVKEYFNLTVPETLKTWTVCETLISVTALSLTLLLAAVV